MTRITNWSCLPNELLELVLKHLTLPDYLRFGAVCKSWRSVSGEKRHSPHPQPPWLMIPTMHNNRICPFFSVADQKLYKLTLPRIADQHCCGSSHGWLVIQLCARQLRSMFILNPFSKAAFMLPPGPSFSHKVILSTAPAATADGTGCVVMGVFGNRSSLHFCRLGDRQWGSFTGLKPSYIDDVIFCKGKFYAVDLYGKVVVCDVQARPAKAQVLKIPISPQPMKGISVSHNYLVESFGNLFLVKRLVACNGIQLSRTTVGFTVSKLVWSGWLKWNRVEGLGDSALFLGTNCSLCVSAKGFLGCRENCIYFTDESGDGDPGDLDMGVFHLESGEIQPCVPSGVHGSWPLPVWVTPNPW